jgi:hypothetical protein
VDLRDAFKPNNEIKIGALIPIKAGRRNWLSSWLSKHHKKSQRPKTGEAE